MIKKFRIKLLSNQMKNYVTIGQYFWSSKRSSGCSCTIWDYLYLFFFAFFGFKYLFAFLFTLFSVFIVDHFKYFFCLLLQLRFIVSFIFVPIWLYFFSLFMWPILIWSKLSPFNIGRHCPSLFMVIFLGYIDAV